MSALRLAVGERERLSALEAEALSAVLAVFTGDGIPAPGTPQVAGSYRLDEQGLHFRPLFPFVSGLRYTVRLDLGGPALLRGFEVAPPEGEPPRVVAVFPSAEGLPENTLRVYLHFSRPMEIQDAHRHVHLLDEHGKALPLPFVEVPHGLWDPGRTRLTVLFHPGRIKRGVAPGERLGPPLRAGERYRLVVDASMRDARGLSLEHDFTWPIRAGGADRDPPRAEALRVRAPEAATAPVTLELPEPLDQALLRRLVWVEDADGQAVAGSVTIARGETLWSFEPERPWAPGRYEVRIHPALEDRAGNRFGRAFDREVDAGPEADERAPFRLAFTVEARGR